MVDFVVVVCNAVVVIVVADIVGGAVIGTLRLFLLLLSSFLYKVVKLSLVLESRLNTVQT